MQYAFAYSLTIPISFINLFISQVLKYSIEENKSNNKCVTRFLIIT